MISQKAHRQRRTIPITNTAINTYSAARKITSIVRTSPGTWRSVCA